MLLPVQTVGVMGDGRTYEFVCALRAVTSVDGMTADFYPFDMGFLGRAATRIINEVKGINRVVYDVTSASRRARSSGSEGAKKRIVGSSPAYNRRSKWINRRRVSDRFLACHFNMWLARDLLQGPVHPVEPARQAKFTE